MNLEPSITIKSEHLNIIYDVFVQANHITLFGFNGNYAFIWSHDQSIQLFCTDMKGGNRPVRCALRALGRQHCVAWASGDQLSIVEKKSDTFDAQVAVK